MEKESKCAFVTQSVKVSRSYYWCSRAIKQRRRGVADEKGRMRETTSYRTQTHCPAFVRTKVEEDGTVSCTYALEHFGHDCSPALIPLNTQQQQILHDVVSQRYQLSRTVEELEERGGKDSALAAIPQRDLRKMIYTKTLSHGSGEVGPLRSPSFLHEYLHGSRGISSCPQAEVPGRIGQSPPRPPRARAHLHALQHGKGAGQTGTNLTLYDYWYTVTFATPGREDAHHRQVSDV